MVKFEKIILTALFDEVVLRIADKLNPKGWIQQHNGYCYLRVNDNYINLIQPMLNKYGNITKPVYFNPSNNIGAHISIIYPDENIVPQVTIGQKHTFSVSGLFKAQHGSQNYFALSVISTSLAALRQKHGLTAQPFFDRQEIPFHITVGVSSSHF